MAKEAITELMPGLTAHPFKDKKRFIKGTQRKLTELYSHHNHGEVVALEQTLDFEGINGKIATFANKRLIEGGTYKTPLGAVSSLTSYEDGVTKTRQLPLRLRLSFSIHSEDELEHILNHIPLVDLDFEFYYLIYSHEFALGTPILDALKRYGNSTLNSTTLVASRSYNEGHRSGPQIILPYNLAELRGVGLTMIKKD